MTSRFAPSWIMTVCVAISVVILVYLGSWQVERLHWKEALIERFTTNIAQTPIPWQEFSAHIANDPQHLQEFKRTAVRGTYLHEHEMYLTGRSRIGEPGLSVLTPFQFTTGEIVLVNRGWIETDFRDPNTRVDGLFTGEIMLEGLYRRIRPVSGIRAMVLPENDLVKNTWYTLDIAAMSEYTGLPLEQGFSLTDSREGEPKPYGRQWNFRLLNNHLQYAITWYSLAVVLLVIYGIFGVKRAHEVQK